MSDPVKISWIDRAKQTHQFHCQRIRVNKDKDIKWRLKDTAKALGRSVGSISEDLLIASWLKTHSEQLKRFDFAWEALRYIRLRKEEMQLDEVE